MKNIDLMTIIPFFILLIFITISALIAYSNYTVCKTYYPEISPLTCVMSSKIRVQK